MESRICQTLKTTILSNKGKLDLSTKMNAAQMRGTLIVKIPTLFTILSETEIKQELGKILSKSKDTTSRKQKKKRGTVQDRIVLLKTTKNIILNWHRVLEKLVSVDIKI